MLSGLRRICPFWYHGVVCVFRELGFLSVLVDQPSLEGSVITFSISGFVVICHLVVKNQILDPLLFLPIRLLLALHGNSKARI